jgi:predicted ATPase/class 3 adenylate cyclase
VPPLPTGTVTLLFTDIQGSTRLLQELGRDTYVRALEIHRRLLRDAFGQHGGVEVEMQGDSFHFAFASAPAATEAAIAAQRALAAHLWPHEPIRVRMGLHTGEPVQSGGLYAGLDVHHAARVMAAGHGGQILLSERTAQLVREGADGLALRDLGEHRLKDLTEPQWLFQVLAEEIPAEFPPLKSISNTNLPAESASFVGRRRELDDLAALLAHGDVRLVTITGTGGTGKTRLALRAAGEAVEAFPNGVFAVSLAPVADAGLVLPTVAQTLGIRETAGEPITRTLAQELADKKLLLVLDNFEHVLDAALDVSDLLKAAPGLTVIATSRERLNLYGEREYRVEPLMEDDAVSLFVDRAEAVQPAFELDGDRESVIEICQRLDGLPLSIELAAARVSLFSPERLLAQLADRLPLLEGGPRDVPHRQQTLRATIAWSYDLLDDSERPVFRRLAVFAGSIDVEAAEVVAGARRDQLQSLVAKNLVTAGLAGRFGMLETIREYARERLDEAGETETTKTLHAEQLATIAAASVHAIVNREPAALERFDAERDNVRAATAWALETGDRELALRFLRNLWSFWWIRGQLNEALSWAQQALALPGRCKAKVEAEALTSASELARAHGDFELAARQKEQAIEFYRVTGNQPWLAPNLADLANVLLELGEVDRAAGYAEEAVAIHRRLGHDETRLAHGLEAVAQVELRRGNLARAAELLEETTAIFRRNELPGWAAMTLEPLAGVYRRRGELERARRCIRDCAELTRVSGGGVDTVLACVAHLAALMADSGEPLTAARLCGAVERGRRETGLALPDSVALEQVTAKLERALGTEAYERAAAEGASWELDEALECGLAHQPADDRR